MKITSPRDNLFIVKQTSRYGSEKIDCEEAVLHEIRVTDRRNCDDPKKIPFNNGTDGDWYIIGENHRVENGGICRDLDWKQVWFAENVDIMRFVWKYGQCVVSINEDGYQTIEIYDSYRE